MLTEGTLPAGYTVKRRKLVKVAGSAADPAVSRAKRARGESVSGHSGEKVRKSDAATKLERRSSKKGMKKGKKATRKKAPR